MADLRINATRADGLSEADPGLVTRVARRLPERYFFLHDDLLIVVWFARRPSQAAGAGSSGTKRA